MQIENLVEEFLEEMKGEDTPEGGQKPDAPSSVQKPVEEGKEELDENGNVVVKDENLDNNKKIDDNQDDKPLIEELQDIVGLKLEDSFEDSIEGLAGYVKKASEVLAQQQLENIFTVQPELKNVFEFVLNGGDLTKYTSVNQEALDIESLDVTTEFGARKANELLMIEQGIPQDRISKLLSNYQKAGVLEEMGKEAKEILVSKAEEKRIQMQNDAAKAAKDQADADAKYWENVRNQVMIQGKFQDITIPQIEREKFFEYLAKPVKDGKSQAEIDTEIEEIDMTLAINYLRYKKFDLSSLVQSRSKTESVKGLRNRMSGANNFSGKTKGALDSEAVVDSFIQNANIIQM